MHGMQQTLEARKRCCKEVYRRLFASKVYSLWGCIRTSLACSAAELNRWRM